MTDTIHMGLCSVFFMAWKATRRQLRLSCIGGGIALVSALVFQPVHAAEFSLSGFGTLGYARSDQSFNYDRFISERGTFRRDSLVGVQVDAKFTNTFGATAQVVAEPATDDEDRYRASMTWAFVSWRPSNDWLFRFGKQRLPLYLYSQTNSVGASHDFARPPIEMYSLSPNNDMTGATFARTWDVGADELMLEGNVGRTIIDPRVWLRDTIPGLQTAGATYRRLKFDGVGLNLRYRTADSIFRAGVYRAKLTGRSGEIIIAGFPFVTLFPGVGYYQVSNALPGPGVPQIKSVDLSVITLGGDVDLGKGFRVVGEFARSVGNKTALNETANRGYLAGMKQLDRWTPYVLAAYVKSARGPLELNRAINANTVPGFVPGAGLINATQRIGADQVRVQDQHSLAFGVSYQLSPTQKLKAEWMRVRIGRTSSLVDSPSGGDISHQNLNVFSMSYNFVF